MRHADASAMFDRARFDTPAASGVRIAAYVSDFTRSWPFERVQKLGSRRSRYQRAALYAALCEC